MANPYSPPGGDGLPREPNAAEGAAPVVEPRWMARSDVLLLLVLGAAAGPAVFLNALLWFEHFMGLGLYDPAIGGDPAWRTRSVTLPALVGAAAIVRLVAGRRGWSVRRKRFRAYAAVLSIAVLTALAALVPEPRFLAR